MTAQLPDTYHGLRMNGRALGLVSDGGKGDWLEVEFRSESLRTEKDQVKE